MFAGLSLIFGVLSLSASSRTADAASVPVDRLEASVNSSLILLSDVSKFRALHKLRAQLDPLFSGTTVAAKAANASDKEIGEFLIDEKLITQQFPINDQEVEQEINSIQSNNHIDRSALKSALKEQGYAFEDYFELIRASASKRNLIDRDIRTKVNISDDDVKNFFYNNYSRTSGSPMGYHIQIISVSTRSFRTPNAARDAATRAMNDLRGGDSFDEVAKRFSDHPSAQGGGDLGTLTEDQISPQIRDQVKKLQIGQTSEIFGSIASGGFFILKLKDVKSGDSERLERMKAEIRSQLVATEYQHQISLWIERQRQTAFIHRAGESATAGIPAAAQAE